MTDTQHKERVASMMLKKLFALCEQREDIAFEEIPDQSALTLESWYFATIHPRDEGQLSVIQIPSKIFDEADELEDAATRLELKCRLVFGFVHELGHVEIGPLKPGLMSRCAYLRKNTKEQRQTNCMHEEVQATKAALQIIYPLTDVREEWFMTMAFDILVKGSLQESEECLGPIDRGICPVKEQLRNERLVRIAVLLSDDGD